MAAEARACVPRADVLALARSGHLERPLGEEPAVAGRASQQRAWPQPAMFWLQISCKSCNNVWVKKSSTMFFSRSFSFPFAPPRVQNGEC